MGQKTLLDRGPGGPGPGTPDSSSILIFILPHVPTFVPLQVCRKLGIIEVDYFGLQFTGAKGENLWLNLRNRICQQMDNVAPCRLRLRVKFFVEPHLILQEQTRYIFFFTTPARLASQESPHTPFQLFPVVRTMRREALAWSEPLLWVLSVISSLLPQMPCSNLLPGCSRGY